MVDAAHAPLVAFLGLGLGMAALDLGVAWLWRGLPLYRRHLGLMALGLGVSGLLAAHLPLPLGALAAFLGLAVPSLRWLAGRRLRGLSWQRGVARRPEPSRPLIVVADPHWGGTLTGLAEATAAHPEADWLFLGDLFEVWVGVPGLEDPEAEAFLSWVDERRSAGRWVGLWLGNREFFLDRLAARFDLLGEGVGGSLPEEGLAWEHGDLLDGRDWAYRLMFLLFRSGPMWLFARFAPRPWARATAAALRRRFAARPAASGYTVPQEALAQAAQTSGARCFLVGHFHCAAQAGVGHALPWAHGGRFQVWREGLLDSTDAPSSRP